MRVLVTGIHVTDPAAAYAFYTEVLGFQDVLVVPQHDLYILGQSDGSPHGAQINLEPIEDPAIRAYQQHCLREGLPVLMLGVPDAELEYWRLKEAGLTFREELTRSEIGLHFQVEDGVGNVLSIHTG